VINDRLSVFLESNDLISNAQHGYGKGSGTEPAILDLSHDIRVNVDDRRVCATVFIDVSKAYQAVDHSILLAKAESYGIRGVANKLLSKFLSERKQFVKVDNKESDPLNLNLGAPQGSVLSNLSFVIDTNDFAKLPLKGKLRMYIDDTSLFCSGETLIELHEVIQHDLGLIFDLMRINKLAVNFSKTKVMYFHLPSSKLSFPQSIMINNDVVIERVESYKYLGVYFDPTLSWKTHITKLNNTLVSIAAILWKLKWVLPKTICRMIYFAHFHSRIRYAITSWGTASNNLIALLQTTQNRALKSVFNLQWQHPSVKIYCDNEILPIKGLFYQAMLTFIFKIASSNVKSTIQLSTGQPNHYRTRQGNLFKEESFRTAFGMKDITCLGVKMINKLNVDVTSSNFPRFQSKVFELSITPNYVECFLTKDIWKILEL
jgi:hypothetical protein